MSEVRYITFPNGAPRLAVPLDYSDDQVRSYLKSGEFEQAMFGKGYGYKYGLDPVNLIEPDNLDDNAFVAGTKSAVDTLKQIGQGALATMYDTFGAKNKQQEAIKLVRQYQLDQQAHQWRQTAEGDIKPRVSSLEQVFESEQEFSAFLEWLGAKVGEGAVTSVPFVLAGIVSGGIGAGAIGTGLIARQAGMGALKQAFSHGLLGQAGGGLIAGTLANATSLSGLGLMATAYGFGAGDTYVNQLAETDDPNAAIALAAGIPYAAAEGAFGAGAMLLNTIIGKSSKAALKKQLSLKNLREGEVVKISKNIKKATSGQRAGAFGKGVLTSSTGEATAEAIQETVTQTGQEVEGGRSLSELYSSPDFWKQIGEATAAGFAGGGPFGAVGGTVQAMRVGPSMDISINGSVQNIHSDMFPKIKADVLTDPTLWDSVDYTIGDTVTYTGAPQQGSSNNNTGKNFNQPNANDNATPTYVVVGSTEFNGKKYVALIGTDGRTDLFVPAESANSVLNLDLKADVKPSEFSDEQPGNINSNQEGVNEEFKKNIELIKSRGYDVDKTSLGLDGKAKKKWVDEELREVNKERTKRKKMQILFDEWQSKGSPEPGQANWKAEYDDFMIYDTQGTKLIPAANINEVVQEHPNYQIPGRFEYLAPYLGDDKQVKEQIAKRGWEQHKLNTAISQANNLKNNLTEDDIKDLTALGYYDSQEGIDFINTLVGRQFRPILDSGSSDAETGQLLNANEWYLADGRGHKLMKKLIKDKVTFSNAKLKKYLGIKEETKVKIKKEPQLDIIEKESTVMPTRSRHLDEGDPSFVTTQEYRSSLLGEGIYSMSVVDRINAIRSLLLELDTVMSLPYQVTLEKGLISQLKIELKKANRAGLENKYLAQEKVLADVINRTYLLSNESGVMGSLSENARQAMDIKLDQLQRKKKKTAVDLKLIENYKQHLLNVQTKRENLNKLLATFNMQPIVGAVAWNAVNGKAVIKRLKDLNAKYTADGEPSPVYYNWQKRAAKQAKGYEPRITDNFAANSPQVLQTLKQLIAGLNLDIQLDLVPYLENEDNVLSAQYLVGSRAIQVAFDANSELAAMKGLESSRANTYKYILHHEIMHVLRDEGFFKQHEWQALTKSGKQWIKKYRIAERYPELNSNDQIEEAISEAFADYMTGRTVVHGPIAKAFERLKQYLLSLANALTRNKFDKPSAIFEAVDLGIVGKRYESMQRGSMIYTGGLNSTDIIVNQPWSGTDAFGAGQNLVPSTRAWFSKQPKIKNLQNFFKWFNSGGRQSSVMDLNGAPLVVMHTTKTYQDINNYPDNLWDYPDQEFESDRTSINAEKLPTGHNTIINKKLLGSGSTASLADLINQVKKIDSSVKRNPSTGVGKKIGGDLYVHKSSENSIPNLNSFKNKLPKDFVYDIVKYNEKDKVVSFIKSPNWNTVHEPLATTGLKVLSDGTIKELNINQIYHHKWLFVKDNYKGFNVEDSVKRSLAWLPLRKENKIKDFKWPSIGRQEAWNKVVPHIPKIVTTLPTTTTINLDLGGGKYDNATEALQTIGVTNYVWDAFNRSKEHNRAVADLVANGNADSVTIHNVFNVIKENENITKLLLQARNALKPGGKLFISVYPKDSTGVGASTMKGESYQRNEPLSDYLERVRKLFPNAVIKNGMIEATVTTKAPFDTFDMSQSMDFGMHFTATQRHINYIQQENPADIGQSYFTFKGFLNIKNPYRMTDLTTWKPEIVLEQLITDGIITAEQEERLVKRNQDDKGDGSRFYKDVTKILESKGYDGIIYKNKSEDRLAQAWEVNNVGENPAQDTWIAFKPEQFKSVTNNGGYDTSQPSMRASRQWQSTDTTGGWSWDEFVPQNRQQRRINTRKFRAAKKGIDKSVEQNANFNGPTLSWFSKWVGAIREWAKDNMQMAKLFTIMQTKEYFARHMQAALTNKLALYRALIDSDPAIALALRKAQAISQSLQPLNGGIKFVKDANGQIIFRAPMDWKGGPAELDIQAGEVVILEGDVADAFLQYDAVMDEAVRQIRKGMIAGGYMEPLRESLEIIKKFYGQQMQLTTDFIEDLTYGDVKTIIENLRRISDIIEFQNNTPTGALTPEQLAMLVPTGELTKKEVGRIRALVGLNKDDTVNLKSKTGLGRLLQELKKYEQWSKGTYIPLMRFGKFFIKVTNNNVPKELPAKKGDPGAYIKQGTKRTYVTANEEYLLDYQLFDTKRQAEAAVADLKSKYAENENAIVSSAQKNDIAELRRAVKEKAMGLDGIGAFLSESSAETFKDLESELQQVIAENRDITGFDTFMTPRQRVGGIPGYSADFGRAASQFIFMASRTAANNRYMNEATRAKDKTIADAQANEDVHLADGVKEYWTYVNDPKQEFALFRQIGFWWFLGGNMSSAILQVMSNVQFAGPMIAEITGGNFALRGAKAAGQLAKAQADAIKMLTVSNNQFGDTFIDWTKAPPDLIDYIMQDMAGYLKQGQAAHEAGQVPGTENFGSKRKRAIRQFENSIIGGMFNTMEATSRLTSYIATMRTMQNSDGSVNAESLERARTLFEGDQLFREAINRNGGVLTPQIVARYIIDDAFGVYSKLNRSAIMRNWGSLPALFQSYISQMFALMNRMLMKGRTPEQRAAGRRVFARQMLMIVLTGGLFGIPGSDDIEALATWMMNNVPGVGSDLAVDMRTELREMLYNAGIGANLVNAMENGFLEAYLNLDVQRRLSLGNFPGSQQVRAIAAIMGLSNGGSAADFAGAPGSVFMTPIKEGITAFREGRGVIDVAFKSAPLFIRNGYKAYQQSMGQGFVETNFGTVLRDDVSIGETMKQAMGFGSAKTKRARESAYMERFYETRGNKKKKQINAQITNALRDILVGNKTGDSGLSLGGQEKLNELTRALYAWNSEQLPEDMIFVDMDRLWEQAVLASNPQYRSSQLKPTAQKKVEKFREMYDF